MINQWGGFLSVCLINIMLNIVCIPFCSPPTLDMQLSHLDNYFMLKWVIKVINIQGDFCLINNVQGDFCLINNILICGYKYVQLCIENFILLLSFKAITYTYGYPAFCSTKLVSLSLTIDVLTSLAKRHTTRFFYWPDY